MIETEATPDRIEEILRGIADLRIGMADLREHNRDHEARLTALENRSVPEGMSTSTGKADQWERTTLPAGEEAVIVPRGLYKDLIPSDRLMAIYSSKRTGQPLIRLIRVEGARHLSKAEYDAYIESASAYCRENDLYAEAMDRLGIERRRP